MVPKPKLPIAMPLIAKTVFSTSVQIEQLSSSGSTQFTKAYAVVAAATLVHCSVGYGAFKLDSITKMRLCVVVSPYRSLQYSFETESLSDVADFVDSFDYHVFIARVSSYRCCHHCPYLPSRFEVIDYLHCTDCWPQPSRVITTAP